MRSSASIRRQCFNRRQLGLWLANKFEHSGAMVAAVILTIMAIVFALRLTVVKYDLRSLQAARGANLL